MRVEFVRLPSWRGGLLAAEYDRENDVARVNREAIERVRAQLGDGAARDFIVCAIAHERFHRDVPEASEAQAHAHVRATCGHDPAAFEAALRG